MPVKNLSKLLRSSSRIFNQKLTPSATTTIPAASSSTSTSTSGSSPKDLALKKYVSSINASATKNIHKQLLNYKSPKSNSESSSSSPGDFTGTGNSPLLSLADNEESARQLKTEICSILRGDPSCDLDDSPEYDDDGDDDVSYSGVLFGPWIPPASNKVSLRRKEMCRERKQRFSSNNNAAGHFERLLATCAGKLGRESTIQVLSKLGRPTKVNEWNSLVPICVETARKTDDEEVALDQLSVAYKIFEFMKKSGFQIQEMAYGPLLRYLIEFRLVQEFHFFCELIRDESTNPKLAYYEMLLCIDMNDEEKIQELRYNLALYDGEDKSLFQLSYLLAFCDGDREKELLPLLETFEVTEVPSIKDVAKIFKSLGKHSLDSVAERFLATLKVNDCAEDNISSFIYNYAVSNQDLTVEDVILKFKKLHATLELVPVSKQYQKLIRYCCELFKVHKALDIVDEILEAGLTVSLGTFNSLLDGCESSKEYTLVRRIYSMMLSHKVKPETETFRRMINLYVRMRDFEGAYGMIADLEKSNLMPTPGIYNTIMAGYFREKNIKGALKVLRQMEEADVKPDPETYYYLLSNCNSEDDIHKIYEEIEQSGVSCTKRIYMALVNAYATCGQFEKAKQVVLDNKIPGKNLSEIKSVLVSALASNGQISDALTLLDELKEAECDLEPRAAISLIEHLQSEGDLSRLLQLLDGLANSGYWYEGCVRILLYCVHHNHLNTAVDLLKQVRDKGLMDEESWEHLFEELFSHFAENEPSEMKLGMNLLQVIKNELKTQPSRKSLDFLLSACISARDLKTCFVIWEEYKAAGLPYNVLSYLRMYQALLAMGDRKSAGSILGKIPRDDPHVNLVVQECQAAFPKALPPKPEGKNKNTSKKKKKKKKKVVKT